MCKWLQFNGQQYVGVQIPALPGHKLDDSHGRLCSAWTSSLSVTVTQRWQWVPSASQLISAGIAFWTMIYEGSKEIWGDSWLSAIVDLYCWERDFIAISPNGYTMAGSISESCLLAISRWRLGRRRSFQLLYHLTVEEVTATWIVALFRHTKVQWFWSTPYTALQKKGFVAISLAENFEHELFCKLAEQ